jgi:hypothetical protein
MEPENVPKQSDFTRKELEFAVFCVENVAEKLGKPGNEVYNMLTEKSDILDYMKKEGLVNNHYIAHTVAQYAPTLQMGDRKGRSYIVWRLRHWGALRFGYVGATLAVALFAVILTQIFYQKIE